MPVPDEELVLIKVTREARAALKLLQTVYKNRDFGKRPQPKDVGLIRNKHYSQARTFDAILIDIYELLGYDTKDENEIYEYQEYEDLLALVEEHERPKLSQYSNDIREQQNYLKNQTAPPKPTLTTQLDPDLADQINSRLAREGTIT